MNFRQVQKKIKTIGNVKKITKAMQLVAAVKMKKSQQLALDSRYYSSTLETMLSKILKSYDIDQSKIIWNQNKINVDKKLYIIISSNKGLCGGFNFNLFKKIVNEVKTDTALFITLGKKGMDFVHRIGGDVKADFSQEISFINSASAIFNLAKTLYFENQCQSIYLIYNHFISTFNFQPKIDVLLPLVNYSELIDEVDTSIKTRLDYLIEPLSINLINSIIEDLLVQKIRKSILDSEAAENSSRMVAMKNATDSATDVIYNLTLLRNKLRQTSITNELLEMTSAKESTEVS